MKVLVDTSVWSLALRRHKRMPDPSVDELRAPIDEGRVAMIGPIRQKLLSGLRTAEAFERLRNRVHLQTSRSSRRTSSARLNTSTHARRKASRAPNTDFPICAASERRSLPILTTDSDFIRFARILRLALHGRSA
jgi:predicted nucleic acid-binding protein